MTLLWLTAAWVAGLLLGFRFEVPPVPLLLLGAGALALAVVAALVRRSPVLLVMLGLLLLGFWRVEAVAGSSLPPVMGDSAPAAFRGTINSQPQPGGRSVKFVLDVREMDAGGGWLPVSGQTLVYARPPADMVSARNPPYFQPGDFLELDGIRQLPEGVEGFDYPAYLASHGIGGIFFSRETRWRPESGSPGWRAPLFRLRTRLAASLDRALPAPHASLAQALLLGWRPQIPAEVRADFQASGAAHLLAISGMHVGILLAIATGATGWALGWRRWQHWLLPIAVIWAYALVSGLPVSVVRAALMGTLFLAAMAVGRPCGAVAPLSLAALIITVIDPRAVQQVSFQLSFTAMAGVIASLPWQARASTAVHRLADRGPGWWSAWFAHFARWLTAGVIVSLGATLATLPLVAHYFHQVPLLGIPVTILALPSLPFIIGGSLLTALSGLLHPVLGQAATVTAWLPLSYLLMLVSGVPSPVIPGDWTSPWMLWSWYGAVAVTMALPRLKAWGRKVASRLQARSSSMSWGAPVSLRPGGTSAALLGLAAFMASAAVVLVVQATAGADPRLQVYFFDVGQGDSALIITPNGRQVLVDGGRDSESAIRAVSQALPFWDRSLDLVAMTHLDEDHAGGLPAVLDRYRVGVAMVGAPDPAAPLHPVWQDGLARSGTPAVPLAAGHRLELDQGVELLVLNPAASAASSPSGDRNNDSLAFRLSYGDISFMFTADIEAKAERRILSGTLSEGQPHKSDVLKVGHHGSRTSTTAAFLRAVNPSAAVVSAGPDNQYGHPHAEVVARLEDAVGKDGVFRTARHGTIHFSTDGSSLWVETERQPGENPEVR